jgi:hypothetical protein
MPSRVGHTVPADEEVEDRAAGLELIRPEALRPGKGWQIKYGLFLHFPFFRICFRTA